MYSNECNDETSKKTRRRKSEVSNATTFNKLFYQASSSKYMFVQRPFTCSKLTIETLEQGVKYVQILQ